MMNLLLRHVIQKHTPKSQFINQLRSTTQLNQNNLNNEHNLNEENSLNNESSNDASRFSLLNPNSLSYQLVDHLNLKVNKSYETKLVRGNRIQYLNVNCGNCLIYDENDALVRKLIDLFRIEFELDERTAKSYFFKLNLLNKKEFMYLFDHRTSLDRRLRMLKRDLTKEQLTNSFELLPHSITCVRTKLSILKLIGFERVSLTNVVYFHTIVNQQENTLKQLGICKQAGRLIDRILDQLTLSDKQKIAIKLNCGKARNQTIIELLRKLSTRYFEERTNLRNLRMDIPASIDLLNIDKILNFLDHKFKGDDMMSKIKRSSLSIEDRQLNYLKRLNTIFERERYYGFFNLNYDELSLIDNYLKENELEFIWKRFHCTPSLFVSSSRLIARLDYLKQHKVPKQLINRSPFLLRTQQSRLDFLITNFGDSFFEYGQLKSAITNYKQIVAKFNEIGEPTAKQLSFTEFMDRL